MIIKSMQFLETDAPNIAISVGLSKRDLLNYDKIDRLPEIIIQLADHSQRDPLDSGKSLVIEIPASVFFNLADSVREVANNIHKELKNIDVNNEDE